MPHKKELIIKFYFLLIISVAITPTLYVLMSPPRLNFEIASAQVVIRVPVVGWAWALSTDCDTAVIPDCNSPLINGNDFRISGGELELLNRNPAGPGWIALINTTGTPRFAEPGGAPIISPENYGLSRYITNTLNGEGYFDGYIWSSSFGWIEFKNDATWCPPDAPGSQCGATVDDSGRVHGWARILSIKKAGMEDSTATGPGDPLQCGNAGGNFLPGGSVDCYEGWIKLGPDNPGDWNPGDPNNEGLRIQGTGAFTGFAWSDEFGWFEFMAQAGRPPSNSASCWLNVDPRVREIPRSVGSATTIVRWGCERTNNDCVLSASTGVPPSANAPTTNDVFGVEMTFSQTTRYTISCTSAVAPVGSAVEAFDTVTAKFPSQIIECNPNSPNCK